MTRRLLITLALGSAPLALLTSCQEEAAPEATAQVQELTVTTYPILEQEVADMEEWFGYLQGKQDTDICPRVTGFITSQEYKNGQSVKAGDILFKIDPNLFQAELDRAQANLRAAEASLASAEASRDQIKLDLDRFEELVKSNAVSEKDLSDARHRYRAAIAAVTAAEATIEQQKAAVQTAQINLGYTVIRAPYDGIVGESQVSLGDLVSPTTVLANITDVNPIDVLFSVNIDAFVQSFGKTFDPSTTDVKDLPRFAIKLENGSIYEEKGHIISLESKVTGNGLLDVKGEIPNNKEMLRDGMSVRVSMPMKKFKAMLVPESAIRTVLRNSFILIVNKESQPLLVPVSTLGTYEIDITEANGYKSTQKMVAIGNYGKKTLTEWFTESGYTAATEVPVVVDNENGIQAMQISAANSRSEKKQSVKTADFSFAPRMAQQQEENAQKKEKAEPVATLPPFVVKVTPMLQQDVARTNEWFGTLRGVQEASIRPQVSGFLMEQCFKDGELVQAGEVLFRIDPEPYKAALNQATANLHAAEAAAVQAREQLDMNQSNYDRYEELNRTSPGALAEKDLTDARTAVATATAALQKAEASVAQMKAAVQLAQINLDYTTIEAPFDGRAGIHKVSIGTLVSPSSPTPLVTLSSTNPMRVDFNVSGKLALQSFNKVVNSGGDGTQPLPEFTLILADGSHYPEQGKVVTGDNAINLSTGTLKIIGEIPNDSSILRSGMAVRVKADVGEYKNAYLVPARAPMNGKGLDMLILVDPANAPKILPITKVALVNLEIPGPDGKKVLQPMQIVDVNRAAVIAPLLAKAQATSLEALILGGAKVSSWKDLMLQQAGVKTTRELMEKQAGTPLPDDMPQNEGCEDWDKLFLKHANSLDFRTLILSQSGAADELDLIAKKEGFPDAMHMVLAGMGFKDLKEVSVVAEGALMAAQAAGINMECGKDVNKVTPVPFVYSSPQTVTPSVTSEPSAAAQPASTQEN